MPRPTGDAETRLLDAGRELFEEGGLAAVTVRGAARRAGVNLGLFHYHFGSREAFQRRLLQEGYEEFFSALAAETFGRGRPLARLRRALTLFGRYARDHRRALAGLLHDAMRGDRVAVEHARRNFPRHAGVLKGLVEECRRAGTIRDASFAELFPLLFSINVPTLALTMVERAGASRPFGMRASELDRLWMSDEGIDRRVDMILAALAPSGRRR